MEVYILLEAGRGQKCYEGVHLLKTVLIKVAQQHQKPFYGFNQIHAMTSGTKGMSHLTATTLLRSGSESEWPFDQA